MLINHRRRRHRNLHKAALLNISIFQREGGQSLPVGDHRHWDAPTMMLAERAAAHILGRGLLPAEPAPFYVALNRQSAQR
jgi:hypothetical protein